MKSWNAIKVPILQVVHTSFPNAILTSCPLFSLTFGRVQQQSISKPTQKRVKKSGQLVKVAFGKEVCTTCKIGTLAVRF